MKNKLNLSTWNRKKQYEWFKNFSNSCYSIDSKIDITKLINYCKNNNKSFFICMIYIVTKSLNSIEQMRMRYEEGNVYIYDEITPAYTVMTKSGDFDNVRHEFINDFDRFYDLAQKEIEKIKNQTKLNITNYNPENCYSEYYITSIPWISFNNINHPIPDDKGNATIPRICWDKYQKIDGKFILNLNITVNHMFVDGYPLALSFIKIQDFITDIENLLN